MHRIRHPRTPSTVGAGIEFSVDGDRGTIWAVDISDSSIQLTSGVTADPPPNPPGSTGLLTLGDLFWSNDPTATIIGITNFQSNNVTVTENDITALANAVQIAYTGPLIADGFFSFDLLTTHGAAVPEPGMLSILGFGLAAVGLARRRKRHA